ncbi:hypothetical protein AYI69_g4039 [Smittium culicis]|uniref:Uncharacterized protein n=1 Tax=Smittium culicis TaxID=133412 RepID=A0A1R1YH59_9FUNG|nr:hypothetical protein AYI69_g4039 [Smittium culicis]
MYYYKTPTALIFIGISIAFQISFAFISWTLLEKYISGVNLDSENNLNSSQTQSLFRKNFDYFSSPNTPTSPSSVSSSSSVSAMASSSANSFMQSPIVRRSSSILNSLNFSDSTVFSSKKKAQDNFPLASNYTASDQKDQILTRSKPEDGHVVPELIHSSDEDHDYEENNFQSIINDSRLTPIIIPETPSNTKQKSSKPQKNRPSTSHEAISTPILKSTSVDNSAVSTSTTPKRKLHNRNYIIK